MWVSVKKTKSREPGFSGDGGSAELVSHVTRGNMVSAVVEVARVFRNLRRVEFMDWSPLILTALVQDAEAGNVGEAAKRKIVFGEARGCWSSFYKTSHPSEERRMGHPPRRFVVVTRSLDSRGGQLRERQPRGCGFARITWLSFWPSVRCNRTSGRIALQRNSQNLPLR
jgi:hypothetical protein